MTRDLVRDIMITVLIIAIDITKTISTWLRRAAKDVADWWVREDPLAEAVAIAWVFFDEASETTKKLWKDAVASTRGAWAFRKDIIRECRGY